MLNALDGKGEPPQELIMETLSREYGWLPNEIRDQRIEDIRAYLDIIAARRNYVTKKNV